VALAAFNWRFLSRCVTEFCLVQNRFYTSVEFDAKHVIFAEAWEIERFQTAKETKRKGIVFK